MSDLHSPRLTIVTVTYNDIDALRHTVDSVTAQKQRDAFEYLVIDGASDDETPLFLDTHTTVIDRYLSEPDEGIYDAMNKAARLASGEYILYLNAGDTLVDTDTVCKFLDIIDRETSPADIYYASQYVEKDGSLILEETTPLEAIHHRMPFGHQTAFCKRALLIRYPFNTTYTISADYDFFLRCYHNGKTFRKLDFPVAVFVYGGIAQQQRFAYLLETLSILTHYTDDKTIRESVYYKALCEEFPKDEKVQVCIRRIDEGVEFIVYPFDDTPYKAAFYLYKEHRRIDIRWYDTQMHYILRKSDFGRGKYRVQYFLVPATCQDPGRSPHKITGFSKFVVI